MNFREDRYLSGMLVATLLFIQLFIVSFVLSVTGHPTAANACMAAGLGLYTLVQITAARFASDPKERSLYSLSAALLAAAGLINLIMALTQPYSLASSIVTGLIIGGVAAQSFALMHRRKMRQ